MVRIDVGLYERSAASLEAKGQVDSRLIALLTRSSTAWDWLEDEPDLYSPSDGDGLLRLSESGGGHG